MSPRRPDADVPPGVLLVDKPGGMTSHDVVARARRALSVRKVGHAGSLDPMATGVLLLGLGRGTRLLTHLVGADKDYDATVRLGASTTTDDAEGEVVAYCTKTGHGTRIMPQGTITGMQILFDGEAYMMTGLLDQTKINITAGDSGGELDSGGQDGVSTRGRVCTERS